MKKKGNIVIIFLGLLIILLGIILNIIISKITDKDTFSNIKIDDYQFLINDNYKYVYDKKNNYGELNSDEFLTSYIYISDKDYQSLIKDSMDYTNMGSDEIDSSIEERNFGKYDGYVNTKLVNYSDVDKDYDLVIILVKIEKNRTLVFQYEREQNEENDNVLEDIMNGLNKIKKIK